MIDRRGCQLTGTIDLDAVKYLNFDFPRRNKKGVRVIKTTNPNVLTYEVKCTIKDEGGPADASGRNHYPASKVLVDDEDVAVGITWFVVDLGAAMKVHEFRIRNAAVDGITKFQVEGSIELPRQSDGLSWKSLVPPTEMHRGADILPFPLGDEAKASPVRFIKFTALENDETHAQLRCFKVVTRGEVMKGDHVVQISHPNNDVPGGIRIKETMTAHIANATKRNYGIKVHPALAPQLILYEHSDFEGASH